MSWRASPAAVALVAVLLLLCGASGSVWGSYTSQTVSAGNVIVGATDWVGPQVTMLDPGTPLRGATVSLNATATDVGGMSSVTIQRSPAGAGTWTAVCSDGSAPFNCPLDTTALADGSYDLRAIARDVAGNSSTSKIVAARVVDNNGPTVTLTPVASDVRGVIALGATASDGGTGVASVRIERSLAGLDTWTTICTDASSPYSCSLDTRTLADDLYDLRAVAVDLAGNSTTSTTQDDVQVDNAAPVAVAVTAPASPLRGSVTIALTADDDDSGVATVTLQRSAAGAGVFTNVCTTSTYPYSCALVTTTGATPDGSYDLRAVATDAAGNSTTSAIVTRQIDNSQPSVSVTDPGAFLRATVSVDANAFAGSGVTQVAIQRAPAGTSTFTTICTDPSSPYSCSWNTTAVADGLYDLRAVMTYAGGTTLTSAVVKDRRVDNSAVTGYDVQAENRTGGKAGRLEAGDALVLTWSRRMSPSTLLAGWSGGGALNMVVRLVDGAVAGVGTGSGADGLQLLDAGGSATGLGSVNLKANVIKAKKTTAFTATATQSTVAIGGIDRTVVRITLGAVTSGANNVRTASTTPVMAWTPSATARDLNALACSVAPVSELGIADRDF
jgi:hypothetical protein